MAAIAQNTFFGGKEFEGTCLKPIQIEDLPTDIGVAQFYCYWIQLQDADGRVERNAIQLTSIQKILPWIMVLERISNREQRFLYRLVGTAINDLVGFDATHKEFGFTLTEEIRQSLVPYLTQACDSGTPMLLHGDLAAPDKVKKQISLGIFSVSVQPQQSNQLFLVMSLSD